MTSLYLYQDYQRSNLGAVAPISQVVGGQQKLTGEAAKAIHLLLSNKLAAPVQQIQIAPDGQLVPLPGYDPSVEADFTLFKFFVESSPPEGAGTPLVKAENVLLVNLKQAQDNIMGTPEDIEVIVAKNALASTLLSQAGAPFAVLPSFTEATSVVKTEDKGIKPAAIVGALVGAGVGFLVGGPVGAIVGGLGTGVLVQQVA